MKSLVVKRSVLIAGHKTSVCLEDAFWTSLKEIARVRRKGLSALITAIDTDRNSSNLSSNIRLFVLNFYRERDRQQVIDAARRRQAGAIWASAVPYGAG
jgi:predicted DNA-binding ribbon-helix-helix protein